MNKLSRGEMICHPPTGDALLWTHAVNLFSLPLASRVSITKTYKQRSHSLGYKKNPGLFQDPRSIILGPCCKPAMFKYGDKQQLLTSNHIHSMIAASILEYMFINVTCCEEIAKKLFKHFYGCII